MPVFTSHQRVAVLRGGHTTTNYRSMVTGAALIDVLDASRTTTPIDIIVSPSGEWLYEGRVVQPATILSHIDLAMTAVLGQYGEDGTLARELERNGVRHTGATPFAASQTWQKNLATERLQLHDIRTPRRVVVSAESQGDWHRLASTIADLFGPSYIVKPLSGTQQQHVHLVTRTEHIPTAINSVLSAHPACIIEEYIAGQPITVTTVPHLRDQALYHTPSLQFSHQFSPTGELQADSVAIPATLSRQQRETVHATLDTLYKTLQLSGAVRTDMQVLPSGEVYVVEVNTVSPLDTDSAMLQSLAAVGVSLDEFVQSQVQL